LHFQSNLFKMIALVFLTCILTIAAQDTSAATGGITGAAMNGDGTHPAIIASADDAAAGISLLGSGRGTGSTRNTGREIVEQERSVAAGAGATHIQSVRTKQRMVSSAMPFPTTTASNSHKSTHPQKHR
jgi:hypothetical protein